MVSTNFQFRHGNTGDPGDKFAAQADTVAKHNVDTTAPASEATAPSVAEPLTRPKGIGARFRAWKIPT